MYLWEGENDGEWIYSDPSPDTDLHPGQEFQNTNGSKEHADLLDCVLWTAVLCASLALAYFAYRNLKQNEHKHFVQKHEKTNNIKSLNMKNTFIYGR